MALLAAAACRIVPVPAPSPVDPTYAAVFDTWTQNATLSTSLFDTNGYAFATYLAWPFRKARAAELARERELPAPDAAKLEGAELAARRQFHEVVFALNVGEPDANDLDSATSQWRVALSGGGEQAAPASVERLSSDSQLRALFPYVRPFYVAYLLRFPLTLPGGAPLIPDGANQAVLLIAGPLGRAELIWPVAALGGDALPKP